VHCGKTAEWIRVPFGVVSGVGRGISVLDGGADRRRKGEFWGRICCVPLQPMGTLLRNCARATPSSQITFGEDLFYIGSNIFGGNFDLFVVTETQLRYTDISLWRWRLILAEIANVRRLKQHFIVANITVALTQTQQKLTETRNLSSHTTCSPTPAAAAHFTSSHATVKVFNKQTLNLQMLITTLNVKIIMIVHHRPKKL